MDKNVALPLISADVLLMHAPAFFDFRNCRDVYFPFLSTSGDVPITPLYEYFPVGLKSLHRYLSEQGHSAAIMNLSSLLLRYPKIDLRDLVEAMDVKLIGIDLHWMVHTQGSLAVAKAIKEIRQDIPIVFGGISSTIYAHELIRYPFIDLVMRGYDTHKPMAMLVNALKSGASLARIPNLVWKSKDGTPVDNGMTYKPSGYDYSIDWAHQPQLLDKRSLPISEVVTITGVGCANNCGWCGGSREAFERIYETPKHVIKKSMAAVCDEFASLNALENIHQYHFYPTSTYNETGKRLNEFIDHVAESNFKTVSYEQYRLPSKAVLKRMAEANPRTTITLSPDSHDLKVSRASGRGVYTNEEMEAWIETALEAGIFEIDIWYIVGLPEQDEASVMQTAEYSAHLLHKFAKARVNPLICPMLPYLDPGSNFFVNPEKHGYTVFYRTVEEHRQAATRASLLNRINYETRWLDRAGIVRSGYEAIKMVMQAKADTHFLPAGAVETFNKKTDDAQEFMRVVHEVDNIEDPQSRAAELENLGDEIERRNNAIFFQGVSNQAFPINRKIGGRWFDEIVWDPGLLDERYAPVKQSP